jgi:hypothetical protein
MAAHVHQEPQLVRRARKAHMPQVPHVLTMLPALRHGCRPPSAEAGPGVRAAPAAAIMASPDTASRRPPRRTHSYMPRQRDPELHANWAGAIATGVARLGYLFEARSRIIPSILHFLQKRLRLWLVLLRHPPLAERPLVVPLAGHPLPGTDHFCNSITFESLHDHC